MKTQVITGTKEEIAERLLSLTGDVREAVIYIEEPAVTPTFGDDWLAEMRPYMVHVGDFDDSREAIYSPDVNT